MCANDGTIDDRAGLIDLNLQLSEDRRPVSFLCPVREPVVDGLPRPKSLGQIAPRHSRLCPKKDGVDEEPISAGRLRSRTLLRQQRLQPRPLRLGQRVSVHVDL